MELTLIQKLQHLVIEGEPVEYKGFRIWRIGNTEFKIFDPAKLARREDGYYTTVRGGVHVTRTIVKVSNFITGKNDPLPCQHCGEPSKSPTCRSCKNARNAAAAEDKHGAASYALGYVGKKR